MTLAELMLLVPFVVVCALAALTGVLFPAPGFYRQLNRPDWAPPAWLFGPVWTVLYVMIAVAGWRILLSPPSPGAGIALTAWLVQIVLNAAWTPVFFGLKRPDLGFFIISALIVAIAATIVFAWPGDRLAALLMVPYLGWVGFASALNLAIWRRNGSRPAV